MGRHELSPRFVVVSSCSQTDEKWTITHTDLDSQSFLNLRVWVVGNTGIPFFFISGVADGFFRMADIGHFGISPKKVQKNRARLRCAVTVTLAIFTTHSNGSVEALEGSKNKRSAITLTRWSIPANLDSNS